MSETGYCISCGQVYDPHFVSQCPKCGATGVTSERPVSQSLAPKWGLKFAGVTDQDVADAPEPPAVRISLSWGDAFSIGFKFMVVFALFQAVFLYVAFLIWGN